MDELQNLAKCCRLLRILANENLILTNNLIELNSSRDQWTRRLLFDVFDILNGSRNILFKMTLEHNISIFDSVRYVQKKCELGYSTKETQLLLMQDEHRDFMNDIREANENYKKGSELYTTRRSERETLTYLKILQGFHSLAIETQEADETEVVVEADLTGEDFLNTPTEVQHIRDCDEEVATPVKDDNTSFEPSIKRTRTISPTASNYSKSSTASIFSDLPPKLSDRGWHSSIYELEHVSDHMNGSNSDGEESSSSSESIDRLRNSTKVKDKAALFEKLLSKDYVSQGNQKKSKKKKSYSALTKAHRTIETADIIMERPARSIRSISQSYLEELERCNLSLQSAEPRFDESNENPETSLSKAHGNVVTAFGPKLKVLGLSEDENSKKYRKIKARILQRSRLKAFVTEDNKICYEKL